MPRPRHPSAAVEAAVKYAEELGWRYKAPGKSAHSWGRLLCPEHSRDGCLMSVWSTPRNAENHAKKIIRKVDNCPHC